MMDPTTTLFTFMLLTEPSIRAVRLVGSWDNFSRTYAMERDSRRDPGQWRGCYSFKDIICDGDGGRCAKRDGGLRMGQTYYYYYELDGSHETYDSTQPSTSACPYLPGQRVNTVSVPLEQTYRKRSASLSSLRNEDFQTMNPEHKFVSPRPAPTLPALPPPRRLGTAAAMLRHQRSARSLSPAANWPWSPRKLFSRKSESPAPEMERCQTSDGEQRRLGRQRSATSMSDGVRSRDMSPESLRRFLSDDMPPTPEAVETELPSLFIPEDIAEENEDDDNFATSAVSECAPYTILSPPPAPRTASRGSNASTLLRLPMEEERSLDVDLAAFPAPPTRSPPRIPEALQIPQPSLFTSTESSWYSPLSLPTSPASQSLPSFDHSEAEDEDDDVNEDDTFIHHNAIDADEKQNTFASNLAVSLSAYSLPRSSLEAAKGPTAAPIPFAAVGSPALIARNGSDMPMGNTNLLAAPTANSGLDDLVHELGWMADVIHGKGI